MARGRGFASGLAFPLGWVTLIAAVSSVVVVHLLGQDPFDNPDSLAFEALARSLLAGHGLVYSEPMFPSVPLYAFRAPAYSVFVALGLMLGGVGAVVTLQGALHGISAALVGDIARHLAGPRAAWIAFALRLVWPAAWTHAGQLLSESFFEFTMILAAWLALQSATRRELRWAAAAGVVATVSMLTRPVGLGPLAALALWLGRRFPRAALVFVVAAVIAWLPWPIRNYARLHTFVPLLTMGGVALWNSHTESDPIVSWTYMAEHPELGEVGYDRHFRRVATDVIRQDPPDFLRRLWRATLDYVGPILDRRWDFLLHRFALLAALLALWWPEARSRLHLPALIWLALGAVTIPIVVNTRYRFPSEWCVVLAAAIGLEALIARVGARRATAIAAAGLAACIAFTFAIRMGQGTG
jgi:4-amino-4-deoxy-L-arabinose transferase-like glycosyltransferase